MSSRSRTRRRLIQVKSRRPPPLPGWPTNPRHHSGSRSSGAGGIATSCPASAPPSTSATRASGLAPGASAAASSSARPSWRSANRTSGQARAYPSTTSRQRRSSVVVALRNFRRAGTLKKSDRTSIAVPRGTETGSTPRIRPPSIRTLVPRPGSSAVASSRRATAAIAASASPRKPRLPTRSRSAKLAILLVAWRSKARSASSPPIPQPSSRTAIRPLPPLSSSISIARAPASRAFSMSSLSTEAGRSTTSPAAIWLTS
ncbi:MAG: hypothetical protein BWX64_02809 [Acidobacteria bacterium ADurb.Bin051]|nr:MAG: hypothetical protein BWX64_02809 [Acidobacteria bacterium ADurb.Bin051]